MPLNSMDPETRPISTPALTVVSTMNPGGPMKKLPSAKLLPSMATRTPPMTPQASLR